MRVTQMLNGIPPYMRVTFLPFPPCGTMFHLIFWIAGDVAEYGALDQSAWIIVHRSRGPRSTRSSSTHVTISKPSISLMNSDDRKLIGHSATHGATRGFITMFQWRSDDGNQAEWNPCHGPWSHWFRAIARPKSHRETEGPHFSWKIPYKTMFFSLCNLTFGRIVKKLSDFEGRS